MAISANIETPFQRFIVRDFAYSDEQASKQQEELDVAGTTEKELWASYMLIYHANMN